MNDGVKKWMLARIIVGGMNGVMDAGCNNEEQLQGHCWFIFRMIGGFIFRMIGGYENGCRLLACL